MSIDVSQKVRVYDGGDSIELVQGEYRAKITMTSGIALKDCTWGSDYIEGYAYWCLQENVFMSEEDRLESRKYGTKPIDINDFVEGQSSAFAYASVNPNNNQTEFWISWR